MAAEKKSAPQSIWILITIFATLTALVAGVGLAHPQLAARAPETTQLKLQVAQLSAQLQQLQHEHAMPAEVLHKNRNSICYLYAIYSYQRPGSTAAPIIRRSSGTGFMVADGVIATNRHVAQPWFEDEEAKTLLAAGFKPRLQSLTAFFPAQSEGWELPVGGVTVSESADVAIARFDATQFNSTVAPLPLADGPGEPGGAVVVVGYPMGTVAMVAKSPRNIYRKLASRREGLEVARELAQLSLIRPSSTYGHLGDVVGDTLIYDAATAQGGSGGPVFNSRGEVIGINTAYLDGFAGSTVGVSVNALKDLMRTLNARSLPD